MDYTKFDKLVQREKEMYLVAFKKGLSLAFICRALAFDNWDRVYIELRVNKLVPLLPTRQSFSIPPYLNGTFKKCKHSFPKWCATHYFDLRKAEYALNSNPYDATDPYSQRVFAAVKDEFHNVFVELYGSGNVFDKKFEEYDESRRTRLDCHIDWLEEEGVYRATIPGLKGIEADGDSWDSALGHLKMVYNVSRRIYKLSLMIEHGRDWQDFL